MANIRRDLAKLANDDREPSTDPDVRRLSELLAGLTECLDGLDGRLGAASARGTPGGSGSNNNNTQMVTVDSPRGRSMANKREKGAAGDNLLTIVEETSTEQTHTVTQDASGKRINQTVTSTNKRSTRSFPPNTNNKPRSPMGAGAAAGGGGGGAGAGGAGKR